MSMKIVCNSANELRLAINMCQSANIPPWHRKGELDVDEIIDLTFNEWVIDGRKDLCVVLYVNLERNTVAWGWGEKE